MLRISAQDEGASDRVGDKTVMDAKMRTPDNPIDPRSLTDVATLILEPRDSRGIRVLRRVSKGCNDAIPPLRSSEDKKIYDGRCRNNCCENEGNTQVSRVSLPGCLNRRSTVGTHRRPRWKPTFADVAHNHLGLRHIVTRPRTESGFNGEVMLPCDENYNAKAVAPPREPSG